MKYLKLLLFILLFIMVGVLVVSAQNDPSTNPDANACLEGGSMEGKCNQDSDGDGVASQEEIDWAWTCGWYLIRYEDGLIGASQMPSTCHILISYAINPVCISLGFGKSILYDGTPGIEKNWILYYGDENCHGYPYNKVFEKSSIITASNHSDASDTCSDLYPDKFAAEPIGHGLYICWGSPYI